MCIRDRVDDDTTFCLMLKTWLTKRGFEVENAFSCREALAKLKGTKYDVVLTDLRLPDEDGIYLLKNIKASTPEVQAVSYTHLCRPKADSRYSFQ